MNTQATLPPHAWVNVLSEVLCVDVASKMDSIDISYQRLDKALEGLQQREISGLLARYGMGYTFKQCADVMKDKEGTGTISPERAREILMKTVRKLRRPYKIKLIESSICAYWNLYDED